MLKLAPVAATSGVLITALALASGRRAAAAILTEMLAPV